MIDLNITQIITTVLYIEGTVRVSKILIAGQSDSGYVLKQLRSFKEAPEQLRLSFTREAYFGKLINSLPTGLEACSPQDDIACQDGRQHLVRFVESFEVSNPETQLNW